MKKRTLTLQHWEKVTLKEMRDHHKTPYLRERAAALLKIADGSSAHAVAHYGLLKRHRPDTVYSWLNAYEDRGLAGLYQKPRRRRLFPPQP